MVHGLVSSLRSLLEQLLNSGRTEQAEDKWPGTQVLSAGSGMNYASSNSGDTCVVQLVSWSCITHQLLRVPSH